VMGDHIMTFSIPPKSLRACLGGFNYWDKNCYTCEEEHECKVLKFIIPRASLEKLPQYLSSANKQLREAAQKRYREICPSSNRPV